MVYDMPNAFKIEKMSEIDNKKINDKIEQLFNEIELEISLCESPLEELFSLEIQEHFGYYYFKKKFENLNYEILDFRLQEEIGKYRVDFSLYINKKKQSLNKSTVEKFVIEIDGHDFHEKNKEQVKRDKEKDRFLISEGYTVIRFTGSEIYNSCEEKVKEFLNIVLKECGR